MARITDLPAAGALLLIGARWRAISLTRWVLRIGGASVSSVLSAFLFKFLARRCLRLLARGLARRVLLIWRRVVGD